MSQDASKAQYVTPTPVCSVSCLTSPPPHEMPRTGLDVGPLLLAGVVLVALGLLARRLIP